MNVFFLRLIVIILLVFSGCESKSTYQVLDFEVLCKYIGGMVSKESMHRYFRNQNDEIVYLRTSCVKNRFPQLLMDIGIDSSVLQHNKKYLHSNIEIDWFNWDESLVFNNYKLSTYCKEKTRIKDTKMVFLEQQDSVIVFMTIAYSFAILEQEEIDLINDKIDWEVIDHCESHW